MADICVERHWDKALSDVDLHATLQSAGACLDIHRVNWHGSRLSADGHELFCHFSAADAESVRIALNQAGSPRGDVWVGSVHDAPGISNDKVTKANVLVGCKFEEPVTLEEIEAADRSGASCLVAHRVQRMRTYLSADRKRMISLYRAPDVESVRLALRAASIPLNSVWGFRLFSD